MWCRKLMQIFVILSVVYFNFVECFWLTNSPNSYLNYTNALKVQNDDLFEEARRRKRKKDNTLKGLLVGAILVKMILFPLAVKAMAVMSTISVLLSTMSLIISSIVGYTKIVAKKPPETTVKVVHVNDLWSKGDEAPKDYVLPDSLEYGPNAPLDQIHYKIRK